VLGAAQRNPERETLSFVQPPTPDAPLVRADAK
jgi:hypothetical protein